MITANQAWYQVNAQDFSYVYCENCAQYACKRNRFCSQANISADVFVSIVVAVFSVVCMGSVGPVDFDMVYDFVYSSSCVGDLIIVPNLLFKQIYYKELTND